MRLTGNLPRQSEAQELAWSAMEVIYDDCDKAAALCRKALSIYPDCADAITMLAEIEPATNAEFVERMREAVAAGRRDLSPKGFKEFKGMFWGFHETRPFMRAMSGLAFALLDLKTVESVDGAIGIFEEVLELNPNDNQGVREPLVGAYLQRKRYNDAAAMFERYPDDGMALAAWMRVLHAFATGAESVAAELLLMARARNPHVEAYLTGRKRRPRHGPSMYSMGDESEAIHCADTLWEAWKKHPKAKKWLKAMCPPKA